MTLEEAHRHCREVARREARNFYYGFVLLPPHKRAGIYAAYAFSRRADDSVNDDGPAAGREAAVAALRGQLDAAVSGAAPRTTPCWWPWPTRSGASRSPGSTWTP